MADTHSDAHHGSSLFNLYMIVAVVLSICTATSFLFNYLAQPEVRALTKFISFLLILGVAIVKATLVGMYFMHLKWDWRLLYFLIIPAFILGAMMMVVLMPDILLGTMHDAEIELKLAHEYP